MKTELNNYTLLEIDIVEINDDIITQSNPYAGFYGEEIDLGNINANAV